jgi:branched-chain amino acid transport system ATP-binding protein
MLSLNNIVVHYGGVQALKSISMDIAEGSITCLIGANGAGKSTTLRAISGMAPLTSGEIRFQGRRIDGMSPEEIVELGIGHVPEGKKLFLEMNVRDNLLSGAFLRRNSQRIAADLKRVCGYFPVLESAINRPASQMSGGEQQMLAIGRGLMSNPKLLLLDEPSLGLSPLLTQEVGKIIQRIAEAGVSILLIEQNASLALKLAQKGYVLETGVIAVQGDSADLRRDPHVKAAYLGIDAGNARVQAPDSARQNASRSPRPAPAALPDASETRVAQDDTPEHGIRDYQIQGRRLDQICLNYHTTPALGEAGAARMHDQEPVRPEGRASLSSRPSLRPSGSVGGHAKVVKRVFTPLSKPPKK